MADVSVWHEAVILSFTSNFLHCIAKKETSMALLTKWTAQPWQSPFNASMNTGFQQHLSYTVGHIKQFHSLYQQQILETNLASICATSFTNKSKVHQHLLKWQPQKFEKVVLTSAGCLREWAVVSDHMLKQRLVVAYESFRKKNKRN